MKKIMIIFLIIVGGYLLFTSIGSITAFFTKEQNSVKLTDKINTIEFDINSATVAIIPENREDLKADLEGRGKVIMDERGDTITIRHENNWFESFTLFNPTKLKVYVPNDYHQDMALKVGSGTISLDGKSEKNPFHLEELKIDLGSGNVKLNNLSVDEFDHNGSSGTLSIATMTTNTSSIDLSSGVVNMTNFTGQLDAKVSSGKLDLQLAELKDSVSIDVSSGSVTLDLPDNADFKLDGKTGSGNISYNFPLEVEKMDKRHIKGTHGSGKHEIEVEVSSGNVKIN